MGGSSLHFFILLFELQKILPNCTHRSTNKENIVQRRRNSSSSTVLLQSIRARVTVKSTKRESLHTSVPANHQILVRPNQSLKLTEGAVDDFAARQFAKNDMINRYVRAMNYIELAVRRRSLAPVR